MVIKDSSCGVCMVFLQANPSHLETAWGSVLGDEDVKPQSLYCKVVVEALAS